MEVKESTEEEMKISRPHNENFFVKEKKKIILPSVCLCFLAWALHLISSLKRHFGAAIYLITIIERILSNI